MQSIAAHPMREVSPRLLASLAAAKSSAHSRRPATQPPHSSAEEGGAGTGAGPHAPLLPRIAPLHILGVP